MIDLLATIDGLSLADQGMVVRTTSLLLGGHRPGDDDHGQAHTALDQAIVKGRMRVLAELEPELDRATEGREAARG